MTPRLLTTLALATAATAGAGAGVAHAGEATLWACHGPGGQALGVPPLVASTSGDGVIANYGTGCASPVGALGDGGVTAAFTRPDPQGGSTASWRADVPNGLTVSRVTLNRRTAGFGGTPVPGGAQSYLAETAAGPLESASVADATNAPLSGLFVAPTTGQSFVRFGVRCSLPAVQRCAAPSATPIGVDAGALGITVTDTDAPKGAVGGITSPAAGTMTLSLRATDVGLGLAKAEASVDGVLVASADLGDAACADLSPTDPAVDLPLGDGCPSVVTDVALPVQTTLFGDGAHTIKVVVTDATGNAATVAEDSFAIRNTPPGTQSSAVLTIGNGGTATGGAGGVGGTGGGTGTGGTGGTGGVTGTGGAGCLKPNLSMFLGQRPLRTVKGVPVIVKGARYRYTGTLTCVVNGKRVGAPGGLVVELLNTIGKLTVLKSGITTRSGGGVTIITAYPSARTLVFRYRSPDGTTVRVNIKITVQAAKAKAKAKKKAPAKKTTGSRGA